MGGTASSRTAAVNSRGRPLAAPGLRGLLAVAAGCAALSSPARAADAADPALRDARLVAAQRSDLAVLQVSGQSMLPFFDEGTVIVAQRIDPARLRLGMVAVYVNRFGQTVVHRIVRKVDGGWQVQGYHNRRPDTTVVNAANLLGIVYAVFQPLAPPSPRVAAAGPSPVAIAHAAPAR